MTILEMYNDFKLVILEYDFSYIKVVILKYVYTYRIIISK